MSKSISKKLLSIVLSVCLIISVALPVSVNAQSDDVETLKAAYEAAQAEYDAAKAAYDQAESKAVFKEDFEGETQKVGYRNGSSATKVTADIAEDNYNKYGKVTVNEGHAASGYYGVLDSSPVPVNNTDYYKVIFDYKVTGSGSDSIRFWRTSASSSTGAGTSDYLNNTDGWNTFEFLSPKYTIDTTVFYLQITGATPVGTEICIDNFMVIAATDYDNFVTTKTNLKTKKAALDEAKAAYEGSLSSEELAYINAKKIMNDAKNNLKTVKNELKSNAAFYEDFEGETLKVDYRNGGAQTKVTVDIPEEDGNKYGRVTVNEGHAASGYYGILDTTPVSVNNTDNYKVVFDYKITGNVNNNIRFYRTSASSTTGVGEGYLNATDEWSTYEYSTPKYTIESTVFYLQITGTTPAGTEICIDNFMVLTTADYERLVAARTEYNNALATYESAKAVYEATLSQEELALIAAKENLNTAKLAVENIIAGAAFYEDFEGESQKIGYRNGSSATKVTADITEDSGNKYGRVTVNEGHAASGYYGILDTTPVSVNNTDNYKVVFDYKITGNVNNNIRFYRTSASSTTGVGEGYLNATDEWSTYEYSTPKYTIESTVFYLQITGTTPAGTEICIDNFMVITTADYEKLVVAKAEYTNAVTAYEAAKDAYDESTQESEEQKAARIDFEAKQAAYNAAKTAYDTANSKYAFYEDYSDLSNVKMGYVAKGDANTGSRYYTVDTSGGYAILTATGTAWYGVSLSTANYTSFSVTSGEEYLLKFRYHAASGDLQRYLKIYGTSAATGNAGNILTPTALTINGENKNNLISSANGCKLSDYGLTSDWVDVEIKFTPTTNYAYFYLHTVNGTTTYLDDITVMSKADCDALLTAEENLISAKCEYAVSFENYKPYVADKLDRYAEAVEIANAHYIENIENIRDDAVITEATCIKPGVYYKNCPHCGRISTESFEVDTNASNHKDTVYNYTSMTVRVLHCNDCDEDVKTETVYGIADSNCDGSVNVCDFVKLDNALKQGEALGDNSDLDGDKVVNQNDFAIERNILLNNYKNVTVDQALENNAPVNSDTFNTKNMWAALCVVGDEGTVNVTGDYKITDENLELNTQGKYVTVTGGKLDFSEKTTVNFRGNITLKDISVDWNTATNAEVFANGYKVTIGENVTTNGRLDRIYGGAVSGTIESTDLTLLSGNYNWIYGANKDGTVTGAAKLYVGGSVNSALTDSQIQDHNLGEYYIFGGGRMYTNTVGNVHLTIADNARALKVYGAGAEGNVTGKTEVLFKGGRVMSLTGGLYNSRGSVTNIEVTMSGGLTEQVIGGNESSGMTNAGSSTKVTVTGGTIARRIFGGCYNNWQGGVYSNTVNGTTEVYLGGNLEPSFNYNPPSTFGSLENDNTITAGSRSTTNPSTETSTLYITQSLLDKYNSKLGEKTEGYAYDYRVIVEE